MAATPSPPRRPRAAAPRPGANQRGPQNAREAGPRAGTVRDRGELAVRMAWADPLWIVLLDIRTLVNDWLKYAETKNGAIVGLASAAAAVALAALSDRASDPWPVTLGLALAVACLVLSLLVGLASFLPQTNFTRVLAGRPGAPAAEDNLFFYGHLAKYAPRPLAEAVARRYVGDNPGVGPVSDGHVDLAAQIATNARITLWKLRLFTVAVALFALAVLAFAAALAAAALA